MKTIQEIKTVIQETCEKLGHSALAGLISVSFNSRCKKRLGLAKLQQRQIEIGCYLYLQVSESEQQDTIIHETCHLVAHEIYGNKIRPHGDEWKSLMRKAGGTPKAVHKSLKTDSSKIPVRGMHRVFCGCGPLDVTTRFRNCMLRGKKYHCKKCQKNIAFSSENVTFFNRWGKNENPQDLEQEISRIKIARENYMS